MSDNKKLHSFLVKEMLKLSETIDNSKNVEGRLLNYERLFNSFKPEYKDLFKKLGELKSRCKYGGGKADIKKQELEFYKSKETKEISLRCLHFGVGLTVELEGNKIYRVVDKFNLINEVEKSPISKSNIEKNKLPDAVINNKKIKEVCRLLRERKVGHYNEEKLLMDLIPYVKEDVTIKRICLPCAVSIDLLDGSKCRVNDLYQVIDLYNEVYVEYMNRTEQNKHFDREQ